MEMVPVLTRYPAVLLCFNNGDTYEYITIGGNPNGPDGIEGTSDDHYYRNRINNSNLIYNFLCKNLGDESAEFSNCYDIPLQIVAENEEELWNILN
mgnify:CR=1 FL=1